MFKPYSHLETAYISPIVMGGRGVTLSGPLGPITHLKYAPQHSVLYS